MQGEFEETSEDSNVFSFEGAKDSNSESLEREGTVSEGGR